MPFFTTYCSSKDIEIIQKNHESSADPFSLWEVQIANRDFEGAEQLLARLDTEESDFEVYESEKAIVRIITWWFLGYENRLSELLPAARAFLEHSRDSAGNFINVETYSELALIAAAEGNTDEAQRLVRRSLYESRHDTTLQMITLDNACKILGMAGATAAAVDCLRKAFSRPSFAHPFLEPYLPYYDAMRDEPEFVEMLAEIEEAATKTH